VTSGFGNQLAIYSATGEKIGGIEPLEPNSICGVAVDQATGILYVADIPEFFGEQTTIRRFVPVSNTAPVDATDYTVTSIKVQDGGPCHLAVDSAGSVYASSTNVNGEGPTKRYPVSAFAAVPPVVAGTQIAAKSLAAATDPASDDLYIDEGDQISHFDSTGSLAHVFGKGAFGSGSRGVAIDAGSGDIYVANRGSGSIARFTAFVEPYTPIEHPALDNAVSQPGVHNFGDFQVTPDGHYAAFTSVRPLTGHDSGGHLDVYRYDVGGDALACVSCSPTKARSSGDATLASHGLSLADDGRVFFTTTEALVLRDTDSVKDAYEWSAGQTQLISTGISQFDSGLLSASADGKDVFFFTRDRLSPEDQNGSTMRIYDAREEGGRFAIPDPPQCAASDECHGPGSETPLRAGIASLAGTGGNFPAKKVRKPRRCRKGSVKKRGRCVKKKTSRRGSGNSKGGSR
jgi:hypothetical protein